jgi:predicted nucleic acid-binding protein
MIGADDLIIGANDLMIGTHARSMGAVSVTNNERAWRLKVENRV